MHQQVCNSADPSAQFSLYPVSRLKCHLRSTIEISGGRRQMHSDLGESDRITYVRHQTGAKTPRPSIWSAHRESVQSANLGKKVVTKLFHDAVIVPNVV